MKQNKILSKDEFVKILGELEQTDNFMKEVNSLVDKYKGAISTDFISGEALGIAHKDLVISLLDKIMGSKNKDVDYWVYELEYGKTYFDGCIMKDGKSIEVRTAEQLYDYMVSTYEC